MAIEPLPHAAEPTRQAAKLPAPVSRGVVAACIGYFLGWPVVFFACLPLVTPGDTLQAVLFGAGSLLWLLVCCGLFGLLLRLVDAYTWQNTPQRIRMSRTITVVSWFLGWFPLFSAYSHLTASWIEQHHSWINVSLFILGTIFWLVSCG